MKKVKFYHNKLAKAKKVEKMQKISLLTSVNRSIIFGNAFFLLLQVRFLVLILLLKKSDILRAGAVNIVYGNIVNGDIVK